ncbi:hypothetical protein HK098_004936 [Nowakowskiella sp. JEL0407]|nr:hypothetical protein HK098_004936 [Nowakowskiella sp. JEL0407]
MHKLIIITLFLTSSLIVNALPVPHALKGTVTVSKDSEEAGVAESSGSWTNLLPRGLLKRLSADSEGNLDRRAQCMINGQLGPCPSITPSPSGSTSDNSGSQGNSGKVHKGHHHGKTSKSKHHHGKQNGSKHHGHHKHHNGSKHNGQKSSKHHGKHKGSKNSKHHHGSGYSGQSVADCQSSGSNDCMDASSSTDSTSPVLEIRDHRHSGKSGHHHGHGHSHKHHHGHHHGKGKESSAYSDIGNGYDCESDGCLDLSLSDVNSDSEPVLESREEGNVDDASETDDETLDAQLVSRSEHNDLLKRKYGKSTKSKTKTRHGTKTSKSKKNRTKTRTKSYQTKSKSKNHMKSHSRSKNHTRPAHKHHGHHNRNHVRQDGAHEDVPTVTPFAEPTEAVEE